MEWSGVAWSGVEWGGVEWSGVEWSGVEWSGVEWSGVEWSGVEWSGVEWSGVGLGGEVKRHLLGASLSALKCLRLPCSPHSYCTSSSIPLNHFTSNLAPPSALPGTCIGIAPAHWGPCVDRLCAAVFVAQVGGHDGTLGRDQGDPVPEKVRNSKWNGILLEPVPKLFEQLQQNYRGRLGEAAVARQLRFENVALNTYDGPAQFHIVRAKAGGKLPPWANQVCLGGPAHDHWAMAVLLRAAGPGAVRSGRCWRARRAHHRFAAVVPVPCPAPPPFAIRRMMWPPLPEHGRSAHPHGPFL